MVTDAEANAAGDQTRRDAIDARNQADALIYSVEKTFTENKTKLGAADVSLHRRGARGGQAGREGRGRRGDSCGDERVAARPRT